MQESLPQVTLWQDPVKLYPIGPWLVDPNEYTDYVYERDGKKQAPDLQAVADGLSTKRFVNWYQQGQLTRFVDMSYMDEACQNLPKPVQTQLGKLGGLEVASAHTQGYRGHYQDRTAFFSLPMDSSGSWVYVTALFDGHGPDVGGERVAQMLSEASGVQALAEGMGLWSQRLNKPWNAMGDEEIENGWQFIALQLQKLIRGHLVENLHQSHIALQARSLSMTLQQTLKSLTLVSESVHEKLEPSIRHLDSLQGLLGSFHSLEGIGSTAVFALWQVDPEHDRIDLWIINIGDSWAGLATSKNAHFSFVQEAILTDPFFRADVLARGGKIQTDKEGTLRVNGQYSLCRSLGDLFIIREWTEVKACVQMLGMSPRPTVSRVTFCENPQNPGEIAFDCLGAFVQHCDGMKEADTLNSSQICSYISQGMQKHGDLLQIAEKLVRRAVEGGSHDNCSLQIIDLRPLASPAWRRKFYKQMRPSFVFQPATFFHGFL